MLPGFVRFKHRFQLRRAASCQKAGERGFRKEWVESPYLFFFSHSVFMEALH